MSPDAVSRTALWLWEGDGEGLDSGDGGGLGGGGDGEGLDGGGDGDGLDGGGDGGGLLGGSGGGGDGGGGLGVMVIVVGWVVAMMGVMLRQRAACLWRNRVACARLRIKAYRVAAAT